MYRNDSTVVACTEYNGDKLHLLPGSGMKKLTLMKISQFFIWNSICYLFLTTHVQFPSSSLSIVSASIELSLRIEESKSRKIPIGHRKLVCIRHDSSDSM